MSSDGTGRDVPASIEAASHAADQETSSLDPSHVKPTDSKGWDGKLRVTKDDLRGNKAVITNPEALSDPEYSDEEHVLEGEEIDADEDLLQEYEDDEEDINLVHCRISSIPALKLERFKNVKTICLRQNQVATLEFPSSIGPTLQDLDLYDNAIAHIKGLDALTELTSLDLSFNKIKHIKHIDHLVKLRDLYFVQNKISTIENLDSLTQLRNLELGANRIREVQGLDSLVALEELWLGKNKITQMKGFDALSNLKILSMPSNRLTTISGISHLPNLEELHISHNAITSLAGLESNANLNTLDVSSNPIRSLEGLKPLVNLEEFWASNCWLGSAEDPGWSPANVDKAYTEIEQQLGDKASLKTVYFEGNPLSTVNGIDNNGNFKISPMYRRKVRLALPRIQQIDASMVS